MFVVSWGSLRCGLLWCVGFCLFLWFVGLCVCWWSWLGLVWRWFCCLGWILVWWCWWGGKLYCWLVCLMVLLGVFWLFWWIVSWNLWDWWVVFVCECWIGSCGCVWRWCWYLFFCVVLCWVWDWVGLVRYLLCVVVKWWRRLSWMVGVVVVGCCVVVCSWGLSVRLFVCVWWCCCVCGRLWSRLCWICWLGGEFWVGWFVVVRSGFLWFCWLLLVLGLVCSFCCWCGRDSWYWLVLLGRCVWWFGLGVVSVWDWLV